MLKLQIRWRVSHVEFGEIGGGNVRDNANSAQKVPQDLFAVRPSLILH